MVAAKKQDPACCSIGTANDRNIAPPHTCQESGIGSENSPQLLSIWVRMVRVKTCQNHSPDKSGFTSSARISHAGTVTWEQRQERQHYYKTPLIISPTAQQTTNSRCENGKGHWTSESRRIWPTLTSPGFTRNSVETKRSSRLTRNTHLQYSIVPSPERAQAWRMDTSVGWTQWAYVLSRPAPSPHSSQRWCPCAAEQPSVCLLPETTLVVDVQVGILYGCNSKEETIVHRTTQHVMPREHEPTHHHAHECPPTTNMELRDQTWSPCQLRCLSCPHLPKSDLGCAPLDKKTRRDPRATLPEVNLCCRCRCSCWSRVVVSSTPTGHPVGATGRGRET